MKIEYKTIGTGLGRKREVTKITSHDGINVNSFRYAFSDVIMKQGEILLEKDFNNKISRIRKCEKKVLGELKGEVSVVKYRSANE